MAPDACKQILEYIGIDHGDYKFGKTKIFMKAGMIALLEETRAYLLSSSAVTIQKNYKRYLIRKIYQNKRKLAICLQRAVYKKKSYKRYLLLKEEKRLADERRKKEEEERERKRKEEEERKRKEDDEKRRQEELRKRIDEEARKKKDEEERDKKRKEEEERRRREDLEREKESLKKKQFEETIEELSKLRLEAKRLKERNLELDLQLSNSARVKVTEVEKHIQTFLSSGFVVDSQDILQELALVSLEQDSFKIQNSSTQAREFFNILKVRLLAETKKTIDNFIQTTHGHNKEQAKVGSDKELLKWANLNYVESTDDLLKELLIEKR